jgi:hypothetical protein
MATDSVIVRPSSISRAGTLGRPALARYSGVRCWPPKMSTSTTSMSSMPFSAMNQRTRRGLGARRLS